MKTLKTLIAALLISASAFAQNVGINSDGSTPHGSAMLDVKSTNSGILIPRMTEAQKNAIPSPAEVLKSPNSTHIVHEVLIVEVQAATAEVLVPSVVGLVLGRTPIPGTSKTANRNFL